VPHGTAAVLPRGVPEPVFLRAVVPGVEEGTNHGAILAQDANASEILDRYATETELERLKAHDVAALEERIGGIMTDWLGGEANHPRRAGGGGGGGGSSMAWSEMDAASRSARMLQLATRVRKLAEQSPPEQEASVHRTTARALGLAAEVGGTQHHWSHEAWLSVLSGGGSREDLRMLSRCFGSVHETVSAVTLRTTGIVPPLTASDASQSHAISTSMMILSTGGLTASVPAPRASTRLRPAAAAAAAAAGRGRGKRWAPGDRRQGSQGSRRISGTAHPGFGGEGRPESWSKV
jgi:hypothetical protein